MNRLKEIKELVDSFPHPDDMKYYSGHLNELKLLRATMKLISQVEELEEGLGSLVAYAPERGGESYEYALRIALDLLEGKP